MPSEESGFLGIGSDYEYEVNDEESAIRMGHLKGDSETVEVSKIDLDSIITDALLAQNGSHGRTQKIY